MTVAAPPPPTKCDNPGCRWPARFRIRFREPMPGSSTPGSNVYCATCLQEALDNYPSQILSWTELRFE